MISIVRKIFVNLFKDTDPNQKVIKDSEKIKKQMSILKPLPSMQAELPSLDKVLEETKQAAAKEPQTAALPKKAKKKKNAYKRVARYMPKVTDTMYIILVLFARYELCTDPAFINQLKEAEQAYTQKD